LTSRSFLSRQIGRWKSFLKTPTEMQHNFVVVAPGAKEEIGMAADVMGGKRFCEKLRPNLAKSSATRRSSSPRKGGVERPALPPAEGPG